MHHSGAIAEGKGEKRGSFASGRGRGVAEESSCPAVADPQIAKLLLDRVIERMIDITPRSKTRRAWQRFYYPGPEEDHEVKS